MHYVFPCILGTGLTVNSWNAKVVMVIYRWLKNVNVISYPVIMDEIFETSIHQNHKIQENIGNGLNYSLNFKLYTVSLTIYFAGI